MWACESFSDLASVRRTFHCSAGFIYTSLYQQLELKRRERLYPWPKDIGIDGETNPINETTHWTWHGSSQPDGGPQE